MFFFFVGLFPAWQLKGTEGNHVWVEIIFRTNLTEQTWRVLNYACYKKGNSNPDETKLLTVGGREPAPAWGRFVTISTVVTHVK